MDAAKINRAVNLSITEYDIWDLEDTAISIAEALDSNLANNYKDFFETLARVYYEYIRQNFVVLWIIMDINVEYTLVNIGLLIE